MAASPVTDQTWRVEIASLGIDLPIVEVAPDLAIALMMVTDLGIGFLAHAGRQIADRVRQLEPEVVVGAATLGIPVAIEVTRALGLDRYVVLQKSPKIHLADALTASVTSITSRGEQRLLLDRRAVPLLRGKRVLLVDDVVASGSSLEGALELMLGIDARIAGIGVILTEAFEWQQRLGRHAEHLTRLGHIPQFRRDHAGRWVPISSTQLDGAVNRSTAHHDAA